MTEQPLPPLALISSVTFETEALRRRLHDMRELTVGRKPACTGRLAGVPVMLVTGGMGKTNAAQALTALLETHASRGVLGFGVGGAYPGARLQIGDIALATGEVYGDEGVEAPTGWLSTESIGLPLLQGSQGACFNEIPLPEPEVRSAAQALASEGVVHESGRFVTVSTCSGTEARGRELAARFSAICESMEGAAYAHVSALYGTPFVELRGISNHVEDRDLSRWKLAEAAESAARAVEVVVAAWRR